MQSRTRGFTLMEIIVSMTLFTMIGFAVVLLMPGGMGEFVKAMLLTVDCDPAPGAFAFSDHRHRLLPAV